MFSLSGCNFPVSATSNEGRVRDYKYCKDNGMGAALDYFGQVKCQVRP